MFTMRIVSRDGMEVVKEVKSVMLRPAKESINNRPSLCYFIREGNDLLATDVFDGDVYLMNENGKTVADYHLREFIS